MSLNEIFAINRQGIKLARGLLVVVAMLIPLLVMSAIGLEKYWLSLVFAMLFVALSDPGGTYRRRFRSMAAVGLVGAALTALGFAIGGGPWGVVVVVAFVVTLAAGLSLKFGRHGFTAGLMLDAWFLVAISEPANQHLTASTSGWWQQTLAWLDSGFASTWVQSSVGCGMSVIPRTSQQHRIATPSQTARSSGIRGVPPWSYGGRGRPEAERGGLRT